MENENNNAVIEEPVVRLEVESTGNETKTTTAQKLFETVVEEKPEEVVQPTKEPEVQPQPQATQPQPVQQPPVTPPAPESQPTQLTPPPSVQQPQPVQQRQPAPTPAPGPQFEVYNMSQSDYDSIFEVDSKEESIKNMNTVFQKVVRQALLMSNVLVEEAKKEVLGSVRPYMQFADTHREDAMRQNFYSQHPDLKGQDQVVGLVITQLTQEGKSYDDPKQLFEEVAKRTKAAVSSFSQQGQVSAQPVQQQTAQKPPMAALSTGGQSGAPTRANVENSKQGNTAKRLFG